MVMFFPDRSMRTIHSFAFNCDTLFDFDLMDEIKIHMSMLVENVLELGYTYIDIKKGKSIRSNFDG